MPSAADGADRRVADFSEPVSAAVRTEPADTEKGSDILPARDFVGTFTIFQRPLLLGAVQLAEVVDTTVRRRGDFGPERGDIERGNECYCREPDKSGGPGHDGSLFPPIVDPRWEGVKVAFGRVSCLDGALRTP